MKPIYFIFAAVILFPNFLFAQSHRSANQRMNGVGYLGPQQQELELGSEVLSGTSLARSKVTLTTPYTFIVPNSPHAAPQNQLNLEEKRSIVLLNKDDLSFLDQSVRDRINLVIANKDKNLGFKFKKPGFENFYIFGNFVHSRTEDGESEFFIAIIPRDVAVLDMIFHVAWFDNGAGAHNQLRMIFDQPIVAIPHRDGAIAYKVSNDNNQADIIYTLQAVGVNGGQAAWDPIKGLLGEFGNTLNFYSTPTKAKKQIVHSLVKQYRIEGLTPTQRKNIFVKALNTSDFYEEVSIYNTVFNSCVNHLLRALSAGIPNLDTTKFNPYSFYEYLAGAHGANGNRLTQIEDTLNDEYSRLVSEQELLTYKKLEANKTYRAVNLIRKSILEKPEFDALIQKIALFVMDPANGVTSQQVDIFSDEIKESPLKISSQSSPLLKEMKKQWDSSFKGRSFNDFIKALGALKTQHVKKD